jgi:hypothetical protein
MQVTAHHQDQVISALASDDRDLRDADGLSF